LSPAAITIIEGAALLLSVGALLAASISDFKPREVSNKVWMAYGPAALLLFMARIALSSSPWDTTLVLLVSSLATIVVAFLLFQFGAMGGADSKALMCLGLALPVPPGVFPSFWQTPIRLYPFPIGVLANSFLLSIASGLFILGRNLLRGVVGGRGLFQGFERDSVLRKLMILFTSYKTSFNVLESRTYLFPAEQVEVAGSTPVRHLRLVSSAEEDREKLLSSLESYKAQGLFSDGVWVTPGLPHLVFLTSSLLMLLLGGDLLLWVFFKIVGYS
jgi:preflagellin peptidase FlaK